MPAVVAPGLGSGSGSYAQVMSDGLEQLFAQNHGGTSELATSAIFARQAQTTDDVDTVRLYDDDKRFATQTMAVSLSAISVLASVITFYWFSRMRRRFRHKLIMFLILGSLIRSLFFLVVAAIPLMRHRAVASSSVSCQLSGFMVAFGTEMNDFAALFIAVHSALQVFNPQVSSGSSDGLYNYRYYVYATNTILPALMAGLAFVNPSGRGYLSQGAFCTLPIRPIWYRLALAWIPRYLITIAIIVLAIFIYVHVGFEFKAVASAGNDTDPTDPESSGATGTDKTTTTSMTVDTEITSSDTRAGGSGATNAPIIQGVSGFQDWEKQDHRKPRPVNAARLDSFDRFQFPTLQITEPIDAPSHASERAPDSPATPITSNRPSMTLPRVDSDDSATYHRHIAPATTTPKQSAPTFAPLPQISPSGRRPTFADFARRASQNPALRMEHVRNRIHRQLRLLFVYPAVYIALWIIPFILHCFQYNEYYARNPPFALTILAVACLMSMSFIDCLVFSLRERPWRHIPTSDKSFWGSFYVYKDPEVVKRDDSKRSHRSRSVHHTTNSSNHPAQSDNNEKPTKRSSNPFKSPLTSPLRSSWLSPTSPKKPHHAHSHSAAHTDAEILAADRARERLRFEQAERREMLAKRQSERERVEREGLEEREQEEKGKEVDRNASVVTADTAETKDRGEKADDDNSREWWDAEAGHRPRR